MSASASASSLIGQVFDVEAPSERIDGTGNPTFMGDDLLVRRASRTDSSVGRARASSLLLVCKLCVPPEHGRESLKRDTNDIVIGLLGRERRRRRSEYETAGSCSRLFLLRIAPS